MDGQSTNNQKLIQKLTDIIEANLRDEQFGVSQLAKQMGISRSNLYLKIHTSTQKSVSCFIREIRLRKALEYLKAGEFNVSETAYEVGFKSPAYFIKCFHDFYGFSPGEIQKIENSKNEQADETHRTDHPWPIFKLGKACHQKNRIRTILLVLLAIIVVSGIVFTVVNGLKKRLVSIAVLPLNNLTGNPDNDYFVDGIHDAIIDDLGKISSLRVISSSSSLRFKNSNLLLKNIARKLGVDMVIEGSVMSAGDSVRLLIQLIDVFPKESHIFACEYRDVMKNVLTVQSSASKDIAHTLNAKVTSSEQRRLNRKRTVDPETYKAYLRGMYYINQGTDESFKKGIACLQEAIHRDPGDPFAYAALSLGYANVAHAGMNPEESFASAMAASNKAIMLDPDNDQAYTALALLYLYDIWDWSKAKETFERALQNNPNNVIANANYAWYFILFGDMEKSIHYAHKAVLLEPLSASYKSWLALLCYNNDELDQAEYWANEALALEKDIPYANVALEWVALKRGNYQQALEYNERLPQDDYHNIYRAYTYCKAGQRNKALALWNQLKEKEKSQQGLDCNLGFTAAFLGYKEEAFHYLKIAIDKKQYPVTFFFASPFSTSLREDPRYMELLKLMNLPPNRLLLPSNQYTEAVQEAPSASL